MRSHCHHSTTTTTNPPYSTCDIQSATSTFIDNIPLTSTSRGDSGPYNNPSHLSVTASNSSSIAYHSNNPTHPTSNTTTTDDHYAEHSEADLVGEECRPGPINTSLDARSQALFAVLQDHTYAIQPHPSVSATEAPLSAAPTQKQQQQLRPIPSALQQRHEVAPVARPFSEITSFSNHPTFGSSHVLPTTSVGGSIVGQLMYNTSVAGGPQQQQQQQPHPTHLQTMVPGLTTTTIDGSVIVQKSNLAGSGFNLAYHKQPAGE